MKRDLRSIVAASAFIVVGAFALYYSTDFTPLGSVFPRTIAVLMMVLAVVYVAVALLRPEAAKEPERGSPVRRALLVVTLFAWAFLIERAGFLLTSVVCYALVLLIGNYDRWTPRRAVIYTATGIAVVGGLYALFAYVLQVPFPNGLWL